MNSVRLRTLRGATLLASSATALVLVASAPALAADAATTDDAAAEAAAYGEPIVVTARHREENSQDVPVAISVVDAGSLERSGNFTLNQVQQLVPSLQVASFNPRNTNINIRGLGANSSFAVDGLEYGVGFYLDGVYYARPGQSQFDLVDLQQIEVLHGPQGTLFGKNTTSGAINISSREPSFTPELTAEGQLGNYNYHQIRVSASAPLISDKVAVRLSLSDTHRGGYLTNLFNNSEAQDYDNFSIRGQLLIKPSDDVKIRIIGDYSKQKQHYALTLIDGYFTTFANGAAINNNILQRAARLNYTLPSYGASARLGNSNSPYQANMESYGVSGEVDWDLGPATLTSITAYRWWDWYPSNDTDGTALSIGLKGQQQNFQRQFSQELRLGSNGKNVIDYQVGLYYFWQKVPGYGATQNGSDAAAWNLPTGTPAATVNLYNLALNGYEADSFSNATTKSLAAFGQVDAHLTDALTLTAGLRYTHEYKTGEYRRFGIPSGLSLAGLSAAELATVQAIRTTFQLNDFTFAIPNTKSDALSGLATVSYKVAPSVLVYGTYSHGNKSGGLNITGGGAANPVVKPEKVDNFEVGLKTQFLDNTLTFNAAAFLTNVTDYQANVSVPVGNTTSFIQYIANIPKVRSKGVEVDLAYAPSRWLSLTGSLAYTDARYVNYANAPNAAENNPAVNPVQDLSGVRLPGVSKFAYSLGADVAQPLDQTFEVYGHADFLYRSSFNATATNSIYGNIPAYGLLNAKIGLRTENSRYDFSFWVRNLTNKNYYINRSGSNFGLITGALGDPRTFGGTLRVKY